VSVEALLGRLERWLSVHRLEYFRGFRTGASDADLEAFETRFDVTLPEAFKTLYRWRDGQSPEDFSSLQDNRMFSSLEDIATTKALLDGMIGSDFEDPDWWLRRWVPFLANGGGDHLCVVARTEGNFGVGQLVSFWHDDPQRSVAYASIEDWLEALIDTAEHGKLEFE
jgi:cell wall assembly regulator SMI1